MIKKIIITITTFVIGTSIYWIGGVWTANNLSRLNNSLYGIMMGVVFILWGLTMLEMWSD